jgi:hypothetical protein
MLVAKTGAERPIVNEGLNKRYRIVIIVIKHLLINHNGEHIRSSEQHKHL